MDFRRVILLNQIESISLFDPASASALEMAPEEDNDER